MSENDGERGRRCALVGEIWVVPGDCSENEERVRDPRAQNRGRAHRSSQLVGFFAARLFDHEYIGCHKERIELVQNSVGRA
jgi:hypothetical protein